jgi:hypothetical protein
MPDPSTLDAEGDDDVVSTLHNRPLQEDNTEQPLAAIEPGAREGED